jgi:pectate lyase
MLIRQYSDYFRADAVGLKPGTYTLKVVGKSSGEQTTPSLTVSSYDRTGFTFSSKSPSYGKGIGAYNDDGTLKSGAKVLYVTEKTKTTVQMEINGKTYTGISDITQQIKDKNKCPPVAIRIIGQVSLSDLSCSDMSSAYAIGVKGASQVTFEGIGDDATLNAGIAVFQSTNIEIRNVGLMLWGGGKDGDGIALKKTTGCWIHNNDVFYGLPGSDNDQVKGDGSMDLKDDSQYVTISYNHFWDSGKMSLCGMKSESGPNYISYHHNWFDHSDSRHPRLRTMTIHVYNNYYDGVSKYGVGVTSGGEAFVENNYFRNCKYPMLISLQGSDMIGGGTFSKENGGIIKSYGNIMSGQKAYVTYEEDHTEFDAYEAKSRNEQVPLSVKAKAGQSTYSNFDTNSDLMYKYTPDDAKNVPDIVKSKAGRIFGGDFEFNFGSNDDEDYDVNSALMNKLKAYKSGVISIGSGDYNSKPDDSGDKDDDEKITPITGSVVHNFSTDGINSSFFTINGNLSTSKGSVTYNGLTLTTCLKLESSTNISFTLSSSSKLTLITDASTTNFKLDGNKMSTNSNGVTTVEISAGSHSITKADTGNIFMMIIS